MSKPPTREQPPETPPDTSGGEHQVSVEVVGGRYPYRPVCACGHAFRGYVAHHAAEAIADAHLRGEL